MDLKFSPSPLKGSVAAIPSKSHLHRLLIGAALADSPTEIRAASLSRDVEATVDCLKALGADISYDGARFSVRPSKEFPPSPLLPCGESGSTLRFLLPVAAALWENPSFTGTGRLPDRPIGELLRALASGGVDASASKLPFTLSGKLRGGDYALPGNISSQYITGLLLALPLLSEDSRIRLTSPLESYPYIQMTLEVLETFGLSLRTFDGGWDIPGGQGYRSPGTVSAEGDWSNAAFFLASGAIGGEMKVTGLNLDSLQGDRALLKILEGFGARVSSEKDSVSLHSAPLRGCTIDLRDVPDLLPILAVVAAFAQGETRFTGGARLRLKESDRLASVSALINNLGGDAEEREEGLLVRGRPLTGGSVDSVNDHRIAMATAIAAAHASGPVTLSGAEAVNKSYPNFFKDYTAVGGKIHVI